MNQVPRWVVGPRGAYTVKACTSRHLPTPVTWPQARPTLEGRLRPRPRASLAGEARDATHPDMRDGATHVSARPRKPSTPSPLAGSAPRERFFRKTSNGTTSFRLRTSWKPEDTPDWAAGLNRLNLTVGPAGRDLARSTSRGISFPMGRGRVLVREHWEGSPGARTEELRGSQP